MSKNVYYQYQKELNLPIYISFDPQAFDAGIADFLNALNFTKLSDKEESKATESIRKDRGARCLNIKEATPMVARQIRMTMESDRYGQESIVPKAGYSVYRYRDVGLLVYSFNARDWDLGCHSDFGSSKESGKKQAARVVIHRYLSWALVAHGILGLWGVSVDDGIVLQRYPESKGEAIFVDVVNAKVFSLDGVKKLGAKFKVLRLDPTLKGKNIRMTNEELLSFISAHCSYFDYSGLSIPVRQMIQTFAKMTDGLLHPEESFRPRTDLSL